MSEITLLDGSIGQELVKRSGDRATPLWSTQVMIDHGHLVREVHKDYLDAGATILTTNTYAVHRNRLERVGLEDQHAALLETALSEAEATKGNTQARIAGSLGPLLASYRPDLEADEALAKDRFREIASIMGDRVDILLIETVSSLQEARGALAGMPDGKPVWIAFTVDDYDGTKLRSGEPLTEVLPIIAGKAQAVLINCSRPEVIADAMPILAKAHLPFGAYANGFTHITAEFLEDAPTVDALQQREDLTPAKYAEFAMGWIEQGATIVGGCCETGPDHIRELAHQIRAAGHQIT